MTLEEAHSLVSQRLDGLDFGALLPGFHRFRFALYDDVRVCLGDTVLPWDNRFLGNTAMEYEGGHIAIWKLVPAEPEPDRLAANIVHEMCHAYQLETNAEFADEMAGVFYPRDIDNFSARHEENLLLAGLAEGFTPEAWDRLRGLRAARGEELPQAVGFEFKTEAIEGVALYVELAALKKFSPRLHSKKLAASLAALRDPSLVFDVRLSCYHSGAVARAVATANGLPQALSERAGKGAPARPRPQGQALEAAYREYFGKVDKLIADAMAGAEVLPGGARWLAGFDPFNVRSSGNLLYHPDFIMCKDAGGETRTHMGRFVTAMKGHTREIEAVHLVKG